MEGKNFVGSVEKRALRNAMVKKGPANQGRLPTRSSCKRVNRDFTKFTLSNTAVNELDELHLKLFGHFPATVRLEIHQFAIRSLFASNTNQDEASTLVNSAPLYNEIISATS
jgi:hypothetical protein